MLPEYVAIKEKLEERLALLQGRVSELEAHLRQAHLQPGRDFEDMATDAEDDEVYQQLDDSGRQEVHEILAALARMDAGTYGLCERTGNRIPLRRLQAIPTARFTVPARDDDN
ncbi:MAG: TraR/DksA family transcriptional regulator [Deltaproteobacteria bacterium]|nr:TraR/DksA family transcriptional regulator [Deltaproteobacteria bacterium]